MMLTDLQTVYITTRHWRWQSTLNHHRVEQLDLHTVHI